MFFVIMGHDLVVSVEESKVQDKVIGSMNDTFIALIPKIQKPESFNDFRPISLCNLVYKIISKTIANRIKPIIFEFIAREKFGFLDNCQILDSIGVAQESLHNIKVKKGIRVKFRSGEGI